MFTGDRKKTKDWLHQFRLYAFVNFDKQVIQNPMQRLALALTYIDGEKVREWANQQLVLANTRVQQGVNPQDEVIWDLFSADFENTWRDTSVIEDAQMKLDRLEMGRDTTLEDYIAKFNALISELRWAQNHPGTVRAFQQGLRAGLLASVYKQRPWPPEDDLIAWQDATREEETRGQKIRQNVGFGRRDRSVRQSRAEAYKGKVVWPPGEPYPYQPKAGRKSRDPDAMDVDMAETSQTTNQAGQTEVNGTFKKLSNEERKRLQSEGRCFRCKKQGHMSRDCPLKGRQQPRKTIPFKRKARTTETAEDSSDEDSDVANLEDMRSIASGSTKVSKQATSKGKAAHLDSATLKSMINRLTTEEKQEMFEGFLDEGF